MDERQDLSDQTWLVTLGALAALSILTRVPSIISTPLNSDAVQYILALDRFDLQSHQPHPPGNPLYIILGRAVASIIGDPHVSLVLISLLAGAATVVLSAQLGAMLYDRTLGMLVGALILVNPWVWTYSVVALPYTLEAAAVLLVGLSVLRTWSRPDMTSAMLLGITTAVAAGIRPTVLPFIGLVVLLGVLSLDWRARFGAVAVTSVGCLLWLVPLIHVSGGISRYLEETRALSDASATQTSLFSAGFSNFWVQNLLSFVLSFLLLTLPLLGFVAVSLFRTGFANYQSQARVTRTLLLWGWILPAIVFFVVIHFGQPGYLVFLAPPIVILMTAQMRQTFWSHKFPSRTVLLRATPVIAIGLMLSWLALGPLRTIDQRWVETVAFLEANPWPQRVLVAGPSYRVAGHVLPDDTILGTSSYREGETLVWGARFVASAGEQQYGLGDDFPVCGVVSFPDPVTVVLLDDDLTSRLDTSGDNGWTRYELDHDGEDLWYREFAVDETLVFSRHEDGVQISAQPSPGVEHPDFGVACELSDTLVPES